MGLSEEHRAFLLAAGIDDLRATAVHSISSLLDLPRGFEKYSWLVGSGLDPMVFTWQPFDGPAIHQVRWKGEKDGQPKGEYRWPNQASMVLAVPPGHQELVARSDVPLVIVEGTKQYLAAASALAGAQVAVVGVSGCDGWRCNGKPIPCLERIPLKDRTVFLAFDADVATKLRVWEAANHLADVLAQEIGALLVRFVLLRAGGTAGLDDVLGVAEGHERQGLIMNLLRHAPSRLPARPSATELPHAEKIAKLRQQAATLLAEKVRVTERVPLLRAFARDLDILLKDQELLQCVWDAKRAARGNTEAVAPGEVLTRTKDRWLWEGVLLAACLNLMVALPKAGKTSLLVAVIAAWSRGATEFLGLPLIGPCPPVLLVGVDMPSNDWVEMLSGFGLLNEDDTFGWPIVGLFHKGRPLTLDTVGIEKIEAYAEKHPGLLVLCDSYAELTRGLGLEEKDASFAEPASDLMEALAPHGAGAVIVHHSGKVLSHSAASTASRGTTALPALSSQNINLAPAARGEDWFLDDRRVLVTEGRGGAPVRLLVEREKATGQWVSHGSPDAVEAANRRQKVEDDLTDRQGDVLSVVRLRWREQGERTTVKQVVEILGIQGSSAHKAVWRNLDQLARKSLVQSLKVTLDGTPTDQFWPMGEGNPPPAVVDVVAVSVGGEAEATEAPIAGDGAGTIPPLARGQTQGGIDGIDASVICGGTREGGVWNRSEEPLQTLNDSIDSTPRTSPREGWNRSGPQGGIDSAPPLDDSTPLPAAADPLGQELVPTPKPPRKKRVIKAKPAPTPVEPRVVAAPIPTPFEGELPEDITYVAASTDLPDPDAMPLWLGFDLETFNRRTDLHRHVAGLFPSLGGEIRLAQIHDGSHTWVVDVAVIGAPAIEWLRSLVRNPQRTLCGHNLLFEATFLIAAGIRPLCGWWDTMLASQLIGDLAGSSLASVARHYLGEELDKEAQTSDWGNALTAEQLQYAATDAKVVWPLAHALQGHLKATGQVMALHLENKMIGPCADGQVRGLAVDLEELARLEVLAREARTEKVARLHVLLGIENYRSVEQLHPALAAAVGAPLLKKETNKETGAREDRPTTDAQALAPYRGIPAVDLLLEVRDLDATLKEVTWLRRDIAQGDGRIHPSYRILGANTGRTTTSAQLGEGSKLRRVPSDTEVYGPTAQKAGQWKTEKLPQYGFNFQGLTGRTKAALVTGNPDTVLLDLDWDSIEIALQASPRLYNDSGCRQVLLDGVDPHALMALTLFDLPRPQGLVTKDAVTTAQRIAAKPANFSLAYGCYPKSLQGLLSAAQGVPVAEHKAREVYDAWHRFHPQISREMAQYADGTIYQVRTVSGRRIRNVGNGANADGTRPTFPIYRTNGVNFPIQGSGKDLLADAAGDLWQELDQYPGVRVIGLIHDEFLLEVPSDQLEQVKAAALAVMTSPRLRETYLGDIPLKAAAQVGESWGDAH